MVEGPGATRNARKIQTVVGCAVAQNGRPHSAVTPPELHTLTLQQVGSGSTGTEDASHTMNTLYEGRCLKEAFCVGKEVFLIFDECDTAIRLHFGMNGSLAVTSNGGISSNNRGYGHQSISLQMIFEPSSPSTHQKYYTLKCTGTRVSKISVKIAQSKRTRLQSLDVCSDAVIFDKQKVMEALQSRPTAMISDAVLDQNRYPGVGNIIKIEGLHAAGINPKRVVEKLSDMELSRCIDECHHYAVEWLRRGRAPTKKVYNESNCQTCHSIGSVRMVKLGNDLQRVTFWCERCQSWDPNRTVLSTLSTTQINIQNSTTRNEDHTKSSQNCCPIHGLQSFSIKRVRHKERNKLRLFGTCRFSGCQYFSWADSHLPNCPSCRRTFILRVSKTERSSGRWFLSCANSSTKPCKETFAWATKQQLEPLRKFLTPLL